MSPGLGARTKAGIESELERDLVVHARAAEKQDDLAPPSLMHEELNEGPPVLLVAISLGNDLAYQNGVRADGLGARREGLVLYLRAEIVDFEALVALEALVSRVAFVVENGVDPDRVGVAARARADHG